MDFEYRFLSAKHACRRSSSLWRRFRSSIERKWRRGRRVEGELLTVPHDMDGVFFFWLKRGPDDSGGGGEQGGG